MLRTYCFLFLHLKEERSHYFQDFINFSVIFMQNVENLKLAAVSKTAKQRFALCDILICVEGIPLTVI